MPTLGRVFITGAAGGLGRAFAKYYAGLGYPLALTDLRAEELEEVVRGLESYDVDIRIVVADLATRDGLETTMQAVRQCDDLEILINNAAVGWGENHDFDDCLDVHIAQLDVNARAPLCLSWAAVPVMRLRGRGFIINVASIAGLRPGGGTGMNYASTKAYVVFLSKILQIFVADSGIRVQALCPGLVDTGINPPRFKHVFATFLWTPAAKVAAASHRALRRKRVVVKPGLNVHLTMFFGKLGLIRYYYAVLIRWDRLRRKLKLLPPLPELPAQEETETERETL